MTDKESLRAAVRASRSAMSSAERTAARQAIREVVLRRCRDLALPAGARVAAYQPLRTEPGSVELLAALHSAGYQVVVPHTLPDRDLDWLPWPRPASGSHPSASPILSELPDGPGNPPASPLRPPVQTPSDALGVAAIGTAALLLVPALAVDRQGRRLGRGGGSYDRALARVPPGTVVAALVFADELVERVPTDPWDRPVTAAVSPHGWLDLTRTGRRNT